VPKISRSSRTNKADVHGTVTRRFGNFNQVDCVWNVMAHAQKPDIVFRRNGRVHLNRQGRQFSRLLAAEVCASAVVMLDTPSSEVVWRVLATHSIRQFPLHFPSRASPCAITFKLDSTTSSSSLMARQPDSGTGPFKQFASRYTYPLIVSSILLDSAATRSHSWCLPTSVVLFQQVFSHWIFHSVLCTLDDENLMSEVAFSDQVTFHLSS
jgi:hypothetical protein